jgi:hypothetical protein
MDSINEMLQRMRDGGGVPFAFDVSTEAPPTNLESVEIVDEEDEQAETVEILVDDDEEEEEEEDDDDDDDAEAPSRADE